MHRERKSIIGIRDVITITWKDNRINARIKVKSLTKEQILKTFREYFNEYAPANATIFYYNRGNFERLLELEKEGKLKRRNCEAWAFELA